MKGEEVMVDLKYIGHSAFEIRKDDKAVLIDPLVSVNDKYNCRYFADSCSWRSLG